MPVENGTVPSPCAFVSLPRGFNGTLRNVLPSMGISFTTAPIT